MSAKHNQPKVSDAMMYGLHVRYCRSKGLTPKPLAQFLRNIGRK